jgi:aspartyl-tRNA synthetase
LAQIKIKMHRTHTCGQLRMAHCNQVVTLSGWIQTIRKMGAITFIDLRDRYGITQLAIDESKNGNILNANLGREFVVKATGVVIERSSKNANIKTGEIEIEVQSLTVLNTSITPPFTIDNNTDGGDELRMKYRFLDLRRQPLKDNITLRYEVGRAVRNYLHDQSFLDIETPFLIKSTPEGARDFVVPSRMNQGEFYALPQSPQTFKQLLMVSGYDRYYQIVKCFRDEDLRADRQPEFTQIDCEMAFVEQEDILQMFEGLIKHVFTVVKNINLSLVIERITYDMAMWQYGNDKPDIRFDLKVINLKTPYLVNSHIANEVNKNANSACWPQDTITGFQVFDQAETVLAICVPNGASYSRKQTDELIEWVKRPQIGMGGMAYVKCLPDGTHKSSFDKFYTPDQLLQLASSCNAKSDDIILILAGPEERTRKAISALRMEMADRLGLRNPADFKLLWVLDFPLFEYADEDFGDGKGGGRWVARHHPFTSPKPEHINIMLSNSPSMDGYTHYTQHPFNTIKANAYDMVLNGHEIGGGSIRIFQKALQEKMFEALGMSAEEALHQFGFLLGAFEYGAPPHGGIAFGFDRLCALLGGHETIRDFIAFPKNNAGRDVMLDAPSTIDNRQLKELGLIK